MATAFSYSDRRWRELAAQAHARDGERCSVARLLGGDCSSRLDAHHLVPVSENPALAYDLDNVVTACACHHPQLEALRRHIVHPKHSAVRCRHRHPYPGGREACERRMARLQAA